MDDIVTDRLVLHPLTAAEAERLVAREPAEQERWAPGYPTEGDVKSAKDFLGHCADSGDPHPFGSYEIRLRADGLVIGGLGFHAPPDATRTVTVGYGLVPSARGKGYASESLRALLDLARARGAARVKGDADLGNIASQRVMEAAGMSCTGEDTRVKYYETTWPESDLPAEVSRGGSSAAAAAQEAFLRAFHAVRPDVTSVALGGGRTGDGRSSYEVLADRVRGRRRVLDLGCGDGLLLEILARAGGHQVTGIDLSAEALESARRRSALAGATLRECRAQDLPFVDGVFDACVSHMALMLMADVDRVVAEVARVLSPGGVLACALGGGAVGGEAYELFVGLVRPMIEAVPAARRMPVLGDRRTRSHEGFEAILRPAGFETVGWETLRLDLSGTVEQVWATMSGIYDVAPLDAAALASLRSAFLAEAERITRPDGVVPCAMNIRVATAVLA